MSNIRFDEKFDIFYKFRFHKDYLKNNIDQKKQTKKESKKWFKKNYKKRKFFAIKIKNKIIGLITYNFDNYYYSIIILKKYRNKGVGTISLKKFIKILKKKKLVLLTMVHKKNINSIHIHKKLSKSYKVVKKFLFFKLI
tara:strand:- start:2651 stop:3067 length:417 start_codon:yes stop_codon:yes gene_type:complete